MLSTTKEIELAKTIGILNWPDDTATHATFDQMLLPISCAPCPKLKALLKDAHAGLGMRDCERHGLAQTTRCHCDS